MENIKILILGAILGGIIGFISSYLMWKVQIKQNIRNIAQGFYTEISSLEKKIELFAKIFSETSTGAGLVKIDQPFYNDGLFFAFRREVFSLNKGLAKNLFEFYNYLIIADRDRKIDESDKFYKQANDELKSSIIDAYKLLPKLKKKLKKDFS